MRHGLLRRRPFEFGELTRAFIELRRHFGGLFWRATQCDESSGQFCKSSLHSVRAATVPLLGGLGRENLNAFHTDTDSRLAAFATRTRGCGGVANAAQNVIALDHFA